MGTGIKVLKYHIYGSRYQIVPFMGTGIKIIFSKNASKMLVSYPSRVRGLKCIHRPDIPEKERIVPFMGTGIKITLQA